MNALAYKACQEDSCSTLFAPTMLDGRSEVARGVTRPTKPMVGYAKINLPILDGQRLELLTNQIAGPPPRPSL